MPPSHTKLQYIDPMMSVIWANFQFIIVIVLI